MIVLECGLLKSSKRFYNKKTGSFQKELLKEAIREFHEKYGESPALTTGLKLCLQTNCRERKNAAPILQCIYQCTNFIKENSIEGTSSEEIDYSVNEKTTPEELYWSDVYNQ